MMTPMTMVKSMVGEQSEPASKGVGGESPNILELFSLPQHHSQSDPRMGR